MNFNYTLMVIMLTLFLSCLKKKELRDVYFEKENCVNIDSLSLIKGRLYVNGCQHGLSRKEVIHEYGNPSAISFFKDEFQNKNIESLTYNSSEFFIEDGFFSGFRIVDSLYVVSLDNIDLHIGDSLCKGSKKRIQIGNNDEHLIIEDKDGKISQISTWYE